MRKFYRSKFILLIILSFFLSIVNAQINPDLLKRYDLVNLESLSAEEVKKVKPFWDAILYLQDYEMQQMRFKSTVNFGVNGDEAEDRSLYVANAGLNFQKGFYPGELSVSSSVRVRLDNNVFRENVSTLRMTYDYNFTQETEGYVYLDRFTDNFMNIDQRYELGGGVILPIFGGWSDDKLITTGESVIRRLNKINFDTSANFVQSGWYEVLREQSKKGKENWDENDDESLKNKIINDLITFRKSWKNARATTIKKYAKWRTGILFGIMSETEIANLSGISLNQLGEEKLFEASANKHTWRWTVRPTLDMQPNPFLKLKLRPYFKMPMPWQWQEKVSLGDQSDNRVDWRLDLQTSATVYFPTALWNQNRVISLSFSYRYLRDFSAPRVFLNDLDVNGENVFLKARERHHIVTMAFQVSFN